MRVWLPALALVATAFAAAPAAAGADVRLSNERTVTRWAHANLLSKVRARPSRAARTIARLRWKTEDGPAEVYVVLGSRRVRGRTWMQVRIPGRPNGRRGWVPRDALGGLHKVHTALTIDRGTLRAKLTRGGRVVWTSRVGVGAAGTPTPAGRFWIRERLRGLRRLLRAVGVRDERLLQPAHRLARRRRHRHPRHRPAGADPRPAVARLRARAERSDPPARAAHAGGDAGTDSLTVSSSPSSSRLRRTFLSNLPTLVFGTSSM